jgi:HEAT repeat protein
VPLLLRLLESDVRDVRRACVRALGEIDCEETREALLCAVDDYDSHVRRAAVDALGKIAAEEAFGPVMHLLRKEQYPDVMEAAVGALFAINREKFLSHLEEFGEPVRAVADWFQAR